MATEMVAEQERRLGVRGSANMNVMRTPLTEWRHPFDKEHAVSARVLGPKHVAQTLKWLDQAGPMRLIRRDQHDVDDRLGREPGNSCATEVLQRKRDDAGERGPNAAGFGVEECG